MAFPLLEGKALRLHRINMSDSKYVREQGIEQEYIVLHKSEQLTLF